MPHPAARVFPKHPNSYVPYYKLDAEFAYFFRQNPKARDSTIPCSKEEWKEAMNKSLHHNMRPRLAGEEVKGSSSGAGGELLGHERNMWRSTMGDLGAGNSCGSSFLLHKARSSGSLAATEQTLRAPQGLSTGSTVRIAGLSGRAELNNAMAEVVDDIPDHAGRLHVRLKGAASTDGFGKVLKVRADRLQAEQSRPEEAKAAKLRSTAWPEPGLQPFHHNGRGFGRKFCGGLYSTAIGCPR
eukprot:TRINITY_DN57966_c0_g1_i1.p1 TRINITY_DN57966_c0_g1~~TRINITY_DN57966_c0_g1_i1.p1  ORF type:complete len:241 (+),score=44.53 TRINITY_DN57966_c0_g1_i1:128-850(+)